jgi:hypothetical protein
VSGGLFMTFSEEGVIFIPAIRGFLPLTLRWTRPGWWNFIRAPYYNEMVLSLRVNSLHRTTPEH